MTEHDDTSDPDTHGSETPGESSVDPWADDGDDEWVDEAAASREAEADANDSASDGPPVDTEQDASPSQSEPSGDDSTAAALGPRHYRVLDVSESELVFVDLDVPDPGPGPGPDEGFEPVRVAADSEDDEEVAATVDDLDPGYVVTATLRWPSGDDSEETRNDTSPLARVDSVTVDRESRYYFVDEVEPMFEAARDTWQDTRAAGDSMGSRVTRDTDGDPNGALYVFAEAGARDLLGEFRSGTTPLEPLVDRVNDDLDGDDPREVFVLRPADGGYVVVYIAFELDGLLARTVRDTYC